MSGLLHASQNMFSQTIGGPEHVKHTVALGRGVERVAKAPACFSLESSEQQCQAC